MPPEQYAYRQGRSAHDGIRRVHELVNIGHREVIDADLAGYFDSIPHRDLMRSVSRRISDSRILRLIKMWLQTPVEEIGPRGGLRRLPRVKGRGCPQGAPLSPLLANLYMRRVVLGWKVLGHAARYRAEMVTYADDLVICCKHSAEDALEALRDLMSRLKLTLNEGKTRVCRLPGETFDFLGYTIGRCYSPQTGRAYFGTRPSRKAIRKVTRTISEMTGRRWMWTDVEERVDRLNRLLVGWSNYFCLGQVTKAYAAVDGHACNRLRRWFCRKHKKQALGYSRFPDRALRQKFGLIQLCGRQRSFS